MFWEISEINKLPMQSMTDILWSINQVIGYFIVLWQNNNLLLLTNYMLNFWSLLNDKTIDLVNKKLYF